MLGKPVRVAGKILAVVPKGAATGGDKAFFTRSPKRQTALAVFGNYMFLLYNCLLKNE